MPRRPQAAGQRPPAGMDPDQWPPAAGLHIDDRRQELLTPRDASGQGRPAMSGPGEAAGPQPVVAGQRRAAFRRIDRPSAPRCRAMRHAMAATGLPDRALGMERSMEKYDGWKLTAKEASYT